MLFFNLDNVNFALWNNYLEKFLIQSLENLLWNLILLKLCAKRLSVISVLHNKQR
jgi:hypothetical protein